MVRFEAEVENSKRTANGPTEKDKESSKPKRHFPVTPHPVSKKKRSDNRRKDVDLFSPDPVSIKKRSGDLFAATTNVVSLQMDSSGKMDVDVNADEEEATDNERKFDSEWESFQKSETMTNAPNLKMFLEAQSKRMMDAENFSAALEQCLGSLNSTIHDILNESVVKVHNDQGERFEELEADIVGMMKANHKRRHALLNTLDEANEKWTKQYNVLRGVISQTEVSLNDTDSFHEKAKQSNGEVSNDDIEWEELGDSDFNREKIRCFLSARENFQGAEETLSQSLDDIHEGLKAEVEAIVHIAVEIHNEQENACLALEDDIQFYLMENSKRREVFQESLEESAKQAQGLFANLLSRLVPKL